MLLRPDNWGRLPILTSTGGPTPRRTGGAGPTLTGTSACAPIRTGTAAVRLEPRNQRPSAAGDHASANVWEDAWLHMQRHPVARFPQNLCFQPAALINFLLSVRCPAFCAPGVYSRALGFGNSFGGDLVYPIRSVGFVSLIQTAMRLTSCRTQMQQ